ncbi:hypothetical protein ZIOFF_029958 [Zingiber officinale]|uniref:Carbohydrate kinase PfkB domain-containing protein n=1 Tax=Zingiber officinale TaxID=94328 RepID=A0A8J5GQ98_ZINOF|nr:hypothetical protein ZIOFF_029957 [Zingiber officinale]KAG6511879.1 hypothetical protein ZIOFF_029958 [Zingiber officinale]
MKPSFLNPLQSLRPAPVLLPLLSRAQMSSSSRIPSPPDNGVVLGCGAVSVDFLATVAAFPKPDDKIRSVNLKVEGGGNTGNALTCAARLGLKPRVISKVADDPQGRSMLEELEADGVDTSFMVVGKEGNSPFTYVIVDNQTKTRTCIHTPGNPPLVPEELTHANLSSALDGANLVYFDGRLWETALVVAQETWTNAPSTASALISMLLRLPNLKFVIVTLGEKGCIMLERSTNEASGQEEVVVESLLESLKTSMDASSLLPICISSKSSLRISANGIGAVSGRLLLGKAEVIPPSELVDTTGAGDAFIGAVLYAICAGMSPEKMLPFASQVAAAGCRALGARSGLPKRTNPRLAPFWM